MASKNNHRTKDGRYPRPRARPGFCARAVAAFVLPFALAACDSFSLTGMLKLPGEGGPLSIKAAAETVERLGNPVELMVEGGTPPYELSTTVEDKAPKTELESIGGVVNQSYQPGGAIGLIKITVKDAALQTAEAYITITPRTPALMVARQGPSDIRITLSYFDAARIDGYQIQKSVGGGLFNDFAYIVAWTTELIDNTAPQDHDYAYRIYAVSASYRSMPAEDSP